jgi:hypothetical protein
MARSRSPSVKIIKNTDDNEVIFAKYYVTSGPQIADVQEQ